MAENNIIKAGIKYLRNHPVLTVFFFVRVVSYAFGEKNFYPDLQLKNAKRRTVLSCSCAVFTGTCLVSGILSKTGADKTYEEYKIASDTYSALRLGNRMDRFYANAEGFFIAAESSAVFSTVFGTLAIIDFILYKKNKKTGGACFFPAGNKIILVYKF